MRIGCENSKIVLFNAQLLGDSVGFNIWVLDDSARFNA